MDASLVGAPVFKTVCVALILSQVGSIPTHLRHFIWKRYITDIILEIISSTSALVHLFWYTFLFKLLDIPEWFQTIVLFGLFIKRSFISKEEAEVEKWAVMVSSKTALPIQALEHRIDYYTLIQPFYFV